MASRPRTAFITGGSSGFGRALADRLLSMGDHVFIADLSLTGAEELAAKHNTPTSKKLHYTTCDVSSWSSQLAAFTHALRVFADHIDLVYPIAGIGETQSLPFPSASASSPEFVAPNLKTLSVDLTGTLYTLALSIQHFRHRSPSSASSASSPAHPPPIHGKTILLASICGLVPTPTLPLYTAAKTAVVSLARTYGTLLLREGIAVNAVCPGIARTGINDGAFYAAIEKVEREGGVEVLTSVETVVDACVAVAAGEGSGGVFVCGPGGWEESVREGRVEGWLGRSVEVLEVGHRALHYGEEG